MIVEHQNPGERMRTILTANKHSDIANDTSSRRSEPGPVNRPILPLALETRSAGRGRRAEVEIVDKQTRALVAGVAGNVALILDQRRDVLVVGVAARAIGAVERMVEQVIVHKAIELLGSGKLRSTTEQMRETTEAFKNRQSAMERLFGGRKKGGQLMSRTTEQRGRKESAVFPGTKLIYISQPDQPIIIKPSAVAASVGHAEGRGARLSMQSGLGYSSVSASGERVDAMSMGVAIGGMEMGGGGGSSFSIDIGDLPDFDF